jgi:hypothetical protein
MYSVTAEVGEAPSQVGRHDESFAMQLCVTHTAIDRQFGSFGQLEDVEQQLAATHVAHEGAAMLAMLKISVAPAQVPPSPSTTVPLSVTWLPPSA